MWSRDNKGSGAWCPENDGAYRAEQAAIHRLPSGKWCNCGYPHETGGPCWECRRNPKESDR